MYIDLMSQYNHLQVNIKLANILNLNTAVYWAELLNVYARVINKKKDEMLANGGFFELDRSYIAKRTTLSVDDQMLCDSMLEKLDIIGRDPNDSNLIRIDIQKMYALVVEDDPAAIRDIQKRAKLKRDDQTAVKREMIRRNLNAGIMESDADILEALKVWINAMVEAKTVITKPAVEVFQKNLNAYTDDKSVKLKIIEIATVHAWADFAWAKNCYEKDYRKANGTFIGTTPKPKIGIDPKSGF